jgi:hypothetical protein
VYGYAGVQPYCFHHSGTPLIVGLGIFYFPIIGITIIGTFPRKKKKKKISRAYGLGNHYCPSVRLSEKFVFRFKAREITFSGLMTLHFIHINVHYLCTLEVIISIIVKKIGIYISYMYIRHCF